MSASLLAFAQPSKSGQYRLAIEQKINLNEGLSHPNVNVIHQDRLGFIWIGTDYGLNRYDGHQVQSFYLDQDELSSNRITHILEDAAGVFWLFEAKSFYETCLKVKYLTFWDPYLQCVLSTDQVFQEEIPFLWEEVTHFFQSKEGELYFNLKQQENWVYTKDAKFEKLNAPQGFFPIQSSQHNGIWGQLGNQVLELSRDASTLRSFTLAKGIKCQIIVEDWQEDVHYKSHTVRAQPIPAADAPLGWYTAMGNALPGSVASFLTGNRSSLVIDHEKQIYWVLNGQWFPYDKQGNLLIQQEALPNFRRAKFLQDYLFDGTGLIWDNTNSGIFILKLENDFFDRFLDEPNKKDGVDYKVRGIIAGKNKMLVGTLQGNHLVDLLSGEAELWPLQEGEKMTQSTLTSFTPQNDSIVWGCNYRLSKINIHNWTLEEKIGMPNMNIPGMDAKIWGAFQSRSGKWWMKKQAFLLSYDPEQSDTIEIFDQYNNYDDLKTQLVYHFHENDRGIWLATYQGLYLLDEKKGIIGQYSREGKGTNFLPADRIHFIHPDTSNWFWLATADIGLLHWNYKTGEWKNLSRREGLPSNNLYAILQDSLDYFWISSEEGLIRLHPNRKTFNLFFEEQGLPINEFNRMAFNRSTDGYFYFGGQQGVIRFKPEEFNQRDSLSPYLSIAKGLIFDAEGKLVRRVAANNQRKQKIFLKAYEKRIDLDFSLQDYFQSTRHEYWYRSVKSKDNWVKLEQNHLSLGGLAYGRNKFRVKVVKADGNIADNIMVLTIFQQAPFYLRWWFLLLALFALAFLVFYYTQWRTRKYHRQQKILEQEVAKRVEQIKKDQVIIQSQAAALKALDTGFLEQIDQLILQNLRNSNFSVEELAKAAGLSRSQLHRKLKITGQQTPSSRIRQIRLQRAKALLMDTSSSIAEVAYQCGFQDANYFSRLFKQEFNVSAREFRDQKNKG